MGNWFASRRSEDGDRERLSVQDEDYFDAHESISGELNEEPEDWYQDALGPGEGGEDQVKQNQPCPQPGPGESSGTQR